MGKIISKTIQKNSTKPLIAKTTIFKYIEEIILLIFILIDVFGWLGVLPADMEFGDKLIGWVLMGYLFYKASLTKIILGIRKKWIDVLIILSFFMMIFKNLITLSTVILEEEHLIFPSLFRIIELYSIEIELFSFTMGAIFLVLISLYCCVKLDFKKPSVINIIHEQNKPERNFKGLFLRFMKVHVMFLAFFVIVFNLIMEWLAMVEDDIITIVSIVLVLLILIKYHRQKKRLTQETKKKSKNHKNNNIILSITKIADSFYEKLITQLQSKKKAMLTVSGLLVLHLVTDVATFITPFIFLKKEIEYFGSLGQGHEFIWAIFIKDLAIIESLMQKIILSYVYLMNIIAILLLMLIPAVIWYLMYTVKKEHIPRSIFVLFFMSIICFVLAPAFKITTIKESLTGRIVGVDILTLSPLLSSYFSLGLITIASLLIALVVYVIANHFRNYMLSITLFFTAIFFINYIYNYMVSISTYYLLGISYLVLDMRFIIAYYFIIFFMLNVFFYLFGTISFIYEAIKEVRKK